MLRKYVKSVFTLYSLFNASNWIIYCYNWCAGASNMSRNHARTKASHSTRCSVSYLHAYWTLDEQRTPLLLPWPLVTQTIRAVCRASFENFSLSSFAIFNTLVIFANFVTFVGSPSLVRLKQLLVVHVWLACFGIFSIFQKQFPKLHCVNELLSHDMKMWE